MSDLLTGIAAIWRTAPLVLQVVLVAVLIVHGIALALPFPTNGPSGADRAYPQSTFLKLKGVTTHVLEFDPAEFGWVGTPLGTVVAHHHFYGAAATFTRIGEQLAAEGWTVLAIDRTGFGLTDRPDPDGRWTGPDAPYTRAFTIEQTIELLDQRGVEKAVWLGTSMGGTTVLEATLAHPERVALAIPVAAPLYADASLPQPLRPLLRSWAGTRIGAAAVRRFADPVDAGRVGVSWGDPSAVDELDVDAHARWLGLDGYSQGLWWRMTSDRTPNLNERLDDLKATGVRIVPVAGAQDPLVPMNIVELLAKGVGTDVEVIDCGHVVHAECPAALAAVVLREVAALSEAALD